MNGVETAYPAEPCMNRTRTFAFPETVQGGGIFLLVLTVGSFGTPAVSD